MTVNAYWSRIWVQQRIIPSDRQNIGQILKDNKLDSYDEFDLLMFPNGHCAQDDYYLVSVSEKDFPESFFKRFQKKIEDVVPLTNGHLLIFFRYGNVKKCNMKTLLIDNKAFLPILKDEKMFYRVSMQSGGYGVCWGENLNIADDVLYDCGKDIPLSLEDFRLFVENRVINTTETAVVLDCSRQNIDDLIRRNKLHPLKATPKNKLFLKVKSSSETGGK